MPRGKNTLSGVAAKLLLLDPVRAACRPPLLTTVMHMIVSVLNQDKRCNFLVSCQLARG